jgi:UDP-2,3-diacylglucosamine hydrolase
VSIPPRRIGILAGGGTLPLEVARSAALRGHAVKIIELEGQADADYSAFPTETLNWGKFGRIVRSLKAAGVQDVVMVGRVKRPDMRKIRPDFGLLKALGTVLKILASSGDDSLLRAVLQCFESYGFRVIGAADAAPELLIGEGTQGVVSPSVSVLPSIKCGFEVVRVLGPHDVGQAVVVAGARVEAIEAAEGTDAMLLRVGMQRIATGAARGGVLVKRPKPGQELRVDMPVIGPETVRRASEAGLDGIVVLAGQALIADRAETLRAADEAGLFVSGVPDPSVLVFGPDQTKTISLFSLTRLQPRRQSDLDAARGAAVLESMRSVGESRAVAVARRYVLAVEAGEGVAAMVARAAALRQWGDQTSNKRVGLVTVGLGQDVDSRLVEETARAGLRGIVVLDVGGIVSAKTCAEADQLGVFIARVRADTNDTRVRADTNVARVRAGSSED